MEFKSGERVWFLLDGEWVEGTLKHQETKRQLNHLWVADYKGENLYVNPTNLKRFKP